MIDFLIKSTASLFILLICYYLLLEKEKMHQFNRFFLLFSLVFSFCIPFFTIEIIREVVIDKRPPDTMPFMEASTSITPESTNYLLLLAYVIYGLVTLFLLIRFVLNAVKLHKKSKSHTNVIYKEANLVLLPEITLPYTFLNTIFVNQEDYSNRKIEDELYTHELIHVTQKHTLDILLIELIKIIIWFNPVLYFYKKAIQLNHEFLADEKVATTHKNVPFYQNLLIAKANANPTYYLASNLNYSVTKKRLIMMTKTTSTANAVLKKGLLIPVLTALVFTICTKVVAQEKKSTESSKLKEQKVNLNEIWKNTVFLFRDSNGKIIQQKKYSELTEKQKNNIPPPPPPAILTSVKNQKTPKIKSTDKKIIYINMTSKGAKMNGNIKKKKQNMNAETPPPPPPLTSPFPTINKEKNRDIYETNEISEKPDFPNGMKEFYKFVALNFKAPENPKNLKGKIYITFIIEKDGSITNVRSIRDIGYGTGEEAIRVLKLSPKWTPGKVNNEPVRVMYSLPITVTSTN